MLKNTTWDSEAIFEISSEESRWEGLLRERFADFWGYATGEPWSIYDAFIADCPLTPDVRLEAVDGEGVSGWWVHPSRVAPTGRAVLFLHGGGYVQGSATAYRGFASQIVARTGVPALIIDYPLAPESRWPAGLGAALTAWLWLASRGFESMAIVGDSAGGGLTLSTLLSRRDEA